VSLTIEAVYENGAFRPRGRVELADGAPVRLIVDVIPDERDPLDEVIGIVVTGPDFSLADHHDELIYAPRSQQEDGHP
jgi:predicted DNA-binding antitoxin AbrB/MazE fold protein